MVFASRCRVVLNVCSAALLLITNSAAAQFTSTPTAASRPTLSPALDSVRTALNKYQDPILAARDGYLSTIACFEFPEAGKAGETPYPAGAMGVHLINMSAIGMPLDPAKPQVLIYEQRGDTLKLAAAEWFVPVQISPERPQIFGRPLDGPMDGHQPLMPAELKHWDLHVWLWKANPAGVFTPTNPAVRCPKGVNTLQMRETHSH
jgi:hypothetical protein